MTVSGQSNQARVPDPAATLRVEYRYTFARDSEQFRHQVVCIVRLGGISGAVPFDLAAYHSRNIPKHGLVLGIPFALASIDDGEGADAFLANENGQSPILEHAERRQGDAPPGWRTTPILTVAGRGDHLIGKRPGERRPVERLPDP